MGDKKEIQSRQTSLMRSPQNFTFNVCQKLAYPATKYAIASSHLESNLGFVTGSW
ncbi:MAG: hypothetical protein V7K92_26200 [Nostoc sp.]|uniref:hypothetical protein n=1 Tax=Nostoc sp. TaxID=1180 RepID=UPI002FF36534